MLEANQRAPSAEPSLVDSLVRVVEAGQRIVLDRIDLARFDVSQATRRLLSAAALLGVGTILVTGGWFLLMAGLVCWLQPQLLLPLSFVVAAAVTIAVGGVALAVGTARMREEPGGPTARNAREGSSATATGSNHGDAANERTERGHPTAPSDGGIR